MIKLTDSCANKTQIITPIKATEGVYSGAF
jgi:hypothetical protein